MLQVQNVLLIAYVKSIYIKKSPCCQNNTSFRLIQYPLDCAEKEMLKKKERKKDYLGYREELGILSNTLFSATGLVRDLGQIIYLPVPQSLICDKIGVVVTSLLIGVWINGQAGIAQLSWDAMKRMFQMPKWLPST